MNEVQPHTTTV